MKNKKSVFIISLAVTVFMAFIISIGVFSFNQIDFEDFVGIGALFEKPQNSTEASNNTQNAENSNSIPNTPDNVQSNGNLGAIPGNGGQTIDNQNSVDKNNSTSNNGNAGAAGAQTPSKPETVHTHSFSPATCTKPATCSCGQTSGTVINHSWAEATCTTAKKCKLCGKTQGEALGHRFDCWNKSQCTRCYIDNPALPTPDSFTVVYESQTSTYNGCTVEIGDYYFSDLRDYLVGQAFFYINIKVIASGSTGAVKVEFYDENDCFLTYKTPSVYSGFGLTVGATEEVQCRIPEGAKKIIIKGM